jgi:hypothetical protein
MPFTAAAMKALEVPVEEAAYRGHHAARPATYRWHCCAWTSARGRSSKRWTAP